MDIVSDLYLVQPADLSQVIADAQAGTAAANAAPLLATETLPTIAAVAAYTRPVPVGVITLTGGDQAYDGRGGQWVYDPSDSTSPADPPHLLIGADGARWRQVRDEGAEMPAASYGLVGDGVTVNTTGGVPVGADIDLGGRAYAVEVIPEHFRAYNGVWIVDGQPISAAPERLPAFGPYVISVAEYPWTFFPAGLWYNQAQHRLHQWQVVSASHDMSRGSRVDHVVSRDMGVSTYFRQTIFSRADAARVRCAAIGELDNGRIGGVVTTGDNLDRQWFVWTDDPTASPVVWHHREITGLSLTHQVYGQPMRGFSGAPGDWMVSTYTAGQAKVLRTLDNGTTWTEHVLLDAVGLTGTAPAPAEQVILQTPRGWVMLTRVEGAADNRNLHLSTSPDGAVWTDWQDTGVPLGSNPVHAVMDGGMIEVLLAYRSGFPDSVAGDGLISLRVPIDVAFDDPAAVARLPRRAVADLRTVAIGYFHSIRIPRAPGDTQGRWLHVGKHDESRSTLRQAVSSQVTLSQVPQAAQQPEDARQVVQNAGFGLSRRGTVWSSDTGQRSGPDRWRLSAGSNGATISAERVELTAEQRGVFPMLTHGLRMTSSAAGPDIGLIQRFLGADARALYQSLGGAMTARVYGFGPAPRLVARVSVNGPGAVAQDPGLYIEASPANVTGGWLQEFNVSLGFPEIPVSEVNSVDIYITTVSSAEAFNDTVIAGVFVWLGDAPPYETSVQSWEPDERYLWQRRTATAFRVASGMVVNASTARFILELPFVGAPVLTQSPDASVVVTVGSTDYPVTDISILTADSHDPRIVTLTAKAGGGMPAGSAAQLKIDAGAISLDTGY
ncbi:hypothetical protein [Paracoccus sp. SSJ]|uniref:hypothetical protein n=1 Tax=Paracoccus sp. SSJ TaxID=3050636 RepID=UPI00254A62A0|nr:hypothetical protein [Paracoccus sp. SSJ]MDK8874193.1 hypothetical protein [Paracoccus sp. SSJ]